MSKFAAFGAFNMAICIALGAFGAHKLRALIDARSLEVFQTGIQYHSIHALALLIVPLLLRKNGIDFNPWIFNLMIIGIVLFSVSLYLLSTRTILGFPNATWLGAITPLGGLSFIISWIWLGVELFRK